MHTKKHLLQKIFQFLTEHADWLRLTSVVAVKWLLLLFPVF